MRVFAPFKKSIYKLTGLLRSLEANPSDCEILLNLQRALVTRIRRTEGRIAQLKLQRALLNQQKRRGRSSREESISLKQRINFAAEKIADAQQLLFIWKCFGDGIAYIYHDKFALKHMLYNTHDYEVKQTAGSLSDKEGFRKEWSLLRRLAQQGIPALLCDVTNTVRHGDVCVLSGSDPMPIEVKSSSNRNARAERQIASLQALYKFFETDEATDFRGLAKVTRVELPVSDENHASVMNQCIEQSRARGFAAMVPEEGLTYICLRDSDNVEALNQYIGQQGIISLLNEAKSERAWMPYYPFTLSIRSSEALYEFIKGDVSLGVLLDPQVLVRRFSERGLHAQFIDHPAYFLMVSRVGAVPGNDAFGAVSKQFFGRLFHEFGSLQQMADVELAHMTHLEETGATLEAEIASDKLPQNDGMAVLLPFQPLEWPKPAKNL
jgi:hypothetical protein